MCAGSLALRDLPMWQMQHGRLNVAGDPLRTACICGECQRGSGGACQGRETGWPLSLGERQHSGNVPRVSLGESVDALPWGGVRKLCREPVRRAQPGRFLLPADRICRTPMMIISLVMLRAGHNAHSIRSCEWLTRRLQDCCVTHWLPNVHFCADVPTCLASAKFGGVEGPLS